MSCRRPCFKINKLIANNNKESKTSKLVDLLIDIPHVCQNTESWANNKESEMCRDGVLWYILGPGQKFVVYYVSDENLFKSFHGGHCCVKTVCTDGGDVPFCLSVA